MRSRWTAALSAIAMLALAPSFASANDANVDQQLQQMQNRMQQMEDKLQATTDQLESANQRVDEQSQLIEQSGLAETRGASNGLPGFLGQITVGGWVSSTYFWNLNHPTDTNRDWQAGPGVTCTGTDSGSTPGECGGLGGTNQGINGAYYPLHPDNNSFALDQVWFEIERPIDEENRAGFRLDTVYGKTGALLNGGGPSNRRDGISDDTSIYINQGYVQYLAPIGDGLTFKAGKFGTLIGYEVAQTVYNQNITRSSVYNLLEPIDHIGVLASYAFGDSGFDAAVGGVNGFFPDSPDRNEDKSVIGHVGWANEMLSVGLNGIWGGEVTGFDGNESGLINLLVKVNPTDRLALYVNGDYRWIDASGDPYAWGVEAGGRFAITDRTGVSLRGEYVADNDNFLNFGGYQTTTVGGVTFTDFVPTDIETWGVTGTIDHLLTDQLMVRAEVRWDAIDKTTGGVNNGEFFHGSINNNGSDGGLSSNQVVLGAEVIYNFNKFGGE
jgi:hypothetical protein